MKFELPVEAIMKRTRSKPELQYIPLEALPRPQDGFRSVIEIKRQATMLVAGNAVPSISSARVFVDMKASGSL